MLVLVPMIVVMLGECIVVYRTILYCTMYVCTVQGTCIDILVE